MGFPFQETSGKALAVRTTSHRRSLRCRWSITTPRNTVIWILQKSSIMGLMENMRFRRWQILSNIASEPQIFLPRRISQSDDILLSDDVRSTLLSIYNEDMRRKKMYVKTVNIIYDETARKFEYQVLTTRYDRNIRAVRLIGSRTISQISFFLSLAEENGKVTDTARWKQFISPNTFIVPIAPISFVVFSYSCLFSPSLSHRPLLAYRKVHSCFLSDGRLVIPLATKLSVTCIR